MVEEDSGNYCIICGVDLGYCNPRQYCCKTYCPEEFTSENQYDSDDDVIFHDEYVDDISMLLSPHIQKKMS